MANYDTLKAGFASLLNALGLYESSKIVDFTNAPASEYGNRYILKCLEGENIENTIIDRFEDQQIWQILIAFDRSEHNDIIKYDEANRAKDAIIKAFDKPSNWSSFVKICKYNSWAVIDTPNYFVIDIRLLVVDEYNHG